jgi:hypothetical protein
MPNMWYSLTSTKKCGCKEQCVIVLCGLTTWSSARHSQTNSQNYWTFISIIPSCKVTSYTWRINLYPFTCETEIRSLRFTSPVMYLSLCFASEFIQNEGASTWMLGKRMLGFYSECKPRWSLIVYRDITNNRNGSVVFYDDILFCFCLQGKSITNISLLIMHRERVKAITVAAQSKARQIFVLSDVGIIGSNPTGDMDVSVSLCLCSPV